MILPSIFIVLAFVAVFVIPEIAARRQRSLRTARTLAVARAAAERLHLEPPVATSTGVRARGRIEQLPAELLLATYITWIVVQLDAPGLPPDLSIQRWPTGRALEDVIAANMRKSGHAAFDVHYGIAGPAERAERPFDGVDPALLAAIADTHVARDGRLEIVMMRDKLILRAEGPLAVKSRGPHLDVDEIVALWNDTRIAVSQLAERGVVRAPA